MQVSTILDLIDIGAMALPEFQRGYVWKRPQVRNLINSMYRKYPVGSLLIWNTRTENAIRRGNGPLPQGAVKLILDGQQRMTSLYGIIYGKPPAFFDGDHKTFTGLYFNLESEDFEFYGSKMRNDPLWINVTELMQEGITNKYPEETVNLYVNRMTAITNIKDRYLHVEDIPSTEDIDVVVDIFNKVNSGGTHLSRGDLAMAKICAQWPEARSEMMGKLKKWHDVGFQFEKDWLLRCINTITTGEARFTALEKKSPAEIKEGLEKAEKSIDYLLNLVSSRLGLDHDQVLKSKYAFPLMVKYLDQKGGHIGDYRERDRLLFWYIHTLLWGRYSASNEATLTQDIEAIKDTGLDGLIGLLRQNRGSLKLTAADFIGSSIRVRFYPLLYMLTRVQHARDWETGVELSNNLLGRGTSLQLHHIFPKSLLYDYDDYDYSQKQVNQIANFTFLTQDTNLKISNQDPAIYLDRYANEHPGVLKSHWIPMDPALWKLENYPAFLDERRKLLAAAANRFLNSLESGSLSEHPLYDGTRGGIVNSEEEQVLQDVNDWIVEHGLPEGELSYELVDESTGELKVTLDLAWPKGIQEGYSQPVVLLIDDDREAERAVNQAGYRFFTSAADFKSYVQNEIL